MIRVTENFRKIQDLLAKAATEAGRRPEEVRLLAASKTQSPETVLEAVMAGQRDFGENFAKEGMDKMAAIGRDDLTWHFIGHIQSNKTRLIAENFAWVHTVDRFKIAERLSKQRPFYADELNVCIEVNIDEEEGKSGVTVENTLQLAQAISDLPRIRFRGLMCIPAIRETATEQRKPFARLAELAEDLALAGMATDTLSMGMTADFVPAIQEGATIIRIGTALFGPRKKNSSE